MTTPPTKFRHSSIKDARLGTVQTGPLPPFLENGIPVCFTYTQKGVEEFKSFCNSQFCPITGTSLPIHETPPYVAQHAKLRIIQRIHPVPTSFPEGVTTWNEFHCLSLEQQLQHTPKYGYTKKFLEVDFAREATDPDLDDLVKTWAQCALDNMDLFLADLYVNGYIECYTGDQVFYCWKYWDESDTVPHHLWI